MRITHRLFPDRRSDRLRCGKRSPKRCINRFPGAGARLLDQGFWVKSSSYRAPWWLPGGNLQTIYAASIANAGPVPRYERERWGTPDGDFIDVDWLERRLDRPLVVVFHGLEGNSSSHYAVALSNAFLDAGWRVAIPHFRGCSGEMNRLPRAYHSGDYEEAGWILDRFMQQAHPHGPRVSTK